MKKLNFKSLTPHIVAVGLFVILSFAYFPALFQGKIINQSDISSHQGAAKELRDFHEKTGEDILWTNSMFGGMPSTMILTHYKGNLVESVYNHLFFFDRPASYFLIALVSFYLLLLAAGVRQRLAVVGAFAFTLCSYNLQILQVGHNAKFVAIAFMPAVLASLIYAYRKQPLLGALFFGLTLCFEILANHVQITYYLAMVVVAYGLAQLYIAIRTKTLPRFIKTSCFVILATLLAAGSNVNHLWPTWEYAQYTMRGGSELTINPNKATQTQGGLDKDYAMNWSYGIDETPNLLIPNFNGGASNSNLGAQSEMCKTLQQYGYSAQDAKRLVQSMPTYWGPQMFTAGPMYMGAISVFLFILGLVLIKGPTKWWIASISLLALLLGWGRHLMWLSSLFYDYAPLYNKFRVPSMILVILQMTIPLLGFYCLNKVLNGDFAKPTLLKGLKTAGGITGGFCLLFALLPGLAGSFSGPYDENFHSQLLPALVEDRKSMLQGDAFRSFALIALSAGLIWLYSQQKLKANTAVFLIGVLVLADMWTVDKRYLNNDHFVTRRDFQRSFTLRPADQQILQDKALDYRVLDLSINTFNDSHISYHHKTIGGYSAAKLQRYQDLTDYHLIPEMQAIMKELQQSGITAAEESLARQHVLNMLNTKYVILNANTAVENRHALGNAWFVTDYKLVNTPDEEILTLKEILPAETAIIHKNFAPLLQDKAFNFDENATIQLAEYAPHRLTYKTKAAEEQLALFSEVYYPKGWNVTIDGKPAEHFRANYILRGMLVPAGEHTIQFEYRPESYYLGAKISTIFSGILLLALAGAIAVHLKRRFSKP